MVFWLIKITTTTTVVVETTGIDKQFEELML